MKKTIFFAFIVMLIVSLFPVQMVSADGQPDPIFLEVGVMPGKKEGEFLGGFHFGVPTNEFGVQNTTAFGKVVEFSFDGNPLCTDFGLPKYHGRHSYLIEKGFWSSWGRKTFPLGDEEEIVKVSLLLDPETGYRQIWYITIPTAAQAAEMIINGTANPMPIPFPHP